ncbi:MAG TPA: hypothetical protein VFH73_26475 [Polyangia bacterium]|jgi:hypothetical protein|nr:hypothetical protein [Polyangia bacterium]
MRLAVGVILMSILFCAPLACGKDVSLGSGPAPSDANPDEPDDRQVGGVHVDAGPDQRDTPPVAGTDIRPD